MSTLLLDALLFAVAGSIYALVGRVAIRRRVHGEGQLASTLFGVWWFALAGLQGISALVRVLAAMGHLTLPTYTAITSVSLLVFSAAIWALVYYLFYILTGSRRVLIPLTVFYSLYYASLVYLVAYQVPNGVHVSPWDVRILYEREVGGAPLAAIVLALLVPPLIGALGYARLYFRVEDATQRYRIGLVSATIAVWFGVALFAWSIDIGAAPWWQFVSRLIGLAAALLIYAAYRPPGWVRRRYGVRPIDGPGAT
jgi:hypothetical protein